MKHTTVLWVFLASMVVAGCSSTTVTDREPIADVPLEEALNTISRLNMIQHVDLTAELSPMNSCSGASVPPHTG